MVIGPDFTRNLLSGPLAAIANTVNTAINTTGSVANNAISTSGSVQNNFINQFFGLGNNLVNHLVQPPVLRPPFNAPSPFQLPPAAFQNLNQSIQNLTQILTGMNQNFQQLLGLLGQVLGDGFEQPTSPFQPQPFPSGFERFLENRIEQYGDRASNLTNQAMQLNQESRELRQARALVDAATPLLLTNNPIDQVRGERMLAQAKALSSEDPQLTAIINHATDLSRSSSLADRAKAGAYLNQAENRMTREANSDSFRAQQKLGQASQMLDRMMQYMNVLFSMQQHSYSSFR